MKLNFFKSLDCNRPDFDRCLAYSNIVMNEFKNHYKNKDQYKDRWLMNYKLYLNDPIYKIDFPQNIKNTIDKINDEINDTSNDEQILQALNNNEKELIKKIKKEMDWPTYRLYRSAYSKDQYFFNRCHYYIDKLFELFTKA